MVSRDHRRWHQLVADRLELHGHDLQDARARDDVDAHAAVHVGDVRDCADQHVRHGRAVGALLALFLAQVYNVPFFDPARGGSAILYQHMFWFYSHPAVYIFILPAFGVISEVLPTFARKTIFGYKMIAFSSLAIAILGFAVWAHHMFPGGIAPWLQIPFMIITYLIGIPTGMKIFSWMATIWGGRIQFTTPMLYAMAFIGDVLVRRHHRHLLACVPVDLHEHGSYFVVAHFHYVVAGGAVTAFFAGFYYWFPKATGRLLSEKIGQARLLALHDRVDRNVPPDALARARRDAAAIRFVRNVRQGVSRMRCSGTGSSRSARS